MSDRVELGEVDGLVADAAERWQIIADLAAVSDPFVSKVADRSRAFCRFCEGYRGHCDDCVWLRARRVVDNSARQEIPDGP